jgi:integrase
LLGFYIREDLKIAALDTMDFAGREIDFHGLRNSFISFLANSGTPFKVVRTLARHSEPKLTYNVYARTFKETERKAVAGLPVIDIVKLGINKIISALQDA